jgi:hypothetical protein
MNAVELEAQKAWIAREILNLNDEAMVNNMWLMFKNRNTFVYEQKKPRKREIGFLQGKAKVTFADDWNMTPEELGMG